MSLLFRRKFHGTDEKLSCSKNTARCPPLATATGDNAGDDDVTANSGSGDYPKICSPDSTTEMK